MSISREKNAFHAGWRAAMEMVLGVAQDYGAMDIEEGWVDYRDDGRPSEDKDGWEIDANRT